MTINPGEICESEQLGASTYEKFLDIVRKWVSCIHNELRSAPQWRELNAWRDDVEKMLAELEQSAEGAGEHFSSEEGAALRERLDKLEAEMAAKLQEAVRDQDELQRKTAELHATVEFLKGQVELLDKRTMKKAMMARLFGWFRREDNRKLLKDGAEIAKLVAETTKDLL